jgi:hypothetical protein
VVINNKDCQNGDKQQHNISYTFNPAPDYWLKHIAEQTICIRFASESPEERLCPPAALSRINAPIRIAVVPRLKGSIAASLALPLPEAKRGKAPPLQVDADAITRSVERAAPRNSEVRFDNEMTVQCSVHGGYSSLHGGDLPQRWLVVGPHFLH